MDEKNMPQPMRPHGFAGRIFGFLMERLSAFNYRWVVAQLKPINPEFYLEIGFGTGKLAEMVARRFRPQRLAGLDPSALMFKTALKRLRPFRRKISLELQHGDDKLLANIAGPFDAVVATHSFQFWPDPVAALTRIHDLLSPKGVLILVLRKHISAHVMKLITNPITRSGDEVGGVRKALGLLGFRIIDDEQLKTGSQGIVAVRA